MVCVGMGAHKNMASLSEEAQSEVKKKKNPGFSHKKKSILRARACKIV